MEQNNLLLTTSSRVIKMTFGSVPKGERRNWIHGVSKTGGFNTRAQTVHVCTRSQTLSPVDTLTVQESKQSSYSGKRRNYWVAGAYVCM